VLLDPLYQERLKAETPAPGFVAIIFRRPIAVHQAAADKNEFPRVIGQQFG
jgi:hypothetical protein